MYFMSFTVLGLIAAACGVAVGYGIGLARGREGLRNDILAGKAAAGVTPKQFSRWLDATKDL